jgi:hypothetical protein
MIEDAQTDPIVTITANSNWVECTVRYLVAYKKRRFTKDKLFTRILEEVDKAGDKIKFASSSIQYITPAPPPPPAIKDSKNVST